MEGGERGRVAESSVEELKEDEGKKKKKSPNLGGKGKAILIFLLIGFLCYVFFLDGKSKISFTGIKDTFVSTPDENIAKLITGIKDVDKINKQEGKLDFYDINNIYTEDVAFKQVEKNYFLYVYTGDEEVDKSYNGWVSANTEELPIYKLDVAELEVETTLLESMDGKPTIFLIGDVGGVKDIKTYTVDETELMGLFEEWDKVNQK